MRVKTIYVIYVVFILVVAVAALVGAPGTGGPRFQTHDTRFVIMHFPMVWIFLIYVLLLAIGNYWMGDYRSSVSFLQWIALGTAIVFFFFSPYFTGLFSNGFYHERRNTMGWHAVIGFKRMNKALASLFLISGAVHALFWLYLLFLTMRKIFPGR